METCEENFKKMFGPEDKLNFLNISDGTLHTEDGCQFDIHKIILAKSSPFFRELFCGSDRTIRNFNLSYVSGNILSEILRFIYIRKICITSYNITDILTTAHYLSLDELVNRILKFKTDRINISNCITLFHLSLQLDNERLLQVCLRYIEMHFEEILNNRPTKIAEIPLEKFKELLYNPGLNVSSEKNVWISIVRWVQHVILERQKYVPELLTHLAVEDLDKNLAKEILEHDLVSQNPFCKTLNKKVKPGDYLKALQEFIRNQSSLFTFHEYRMPPKIFAASKLCKNKEYYSVEIHVTYDEKFDFWRKIAVMNFDPDCLVPVGIYILMFDFDTNKCLIFGINEKKETVVDIFSRNYKQHYTLYRAMNIEDIVYIFRPFNHPVTGQLAHCVQNFNPLTHSSFCGVLLYNMCFGDAVAIDKKIYIIGCAHDFETMVAEVYNTESQTVTTLPPPKVFRCDFTTVANQDKLCLIGGICNDVILRNVEVFDTRKFRWDALPDLPYNFSQPRAVNINNEIIVYNHADSRSESMSVRWNETKECWEDLNENSPIRDIHLLHFCELENKDIITELWNENKFKSDEFRKWPLE